MAEAMFRELVRGKADYTVHSAGVSAMRGQPASTHTAQLLKEKSIDLSDFRSRPLTEDLISEATHIFAMAGHHLDAIESQFPEAAEKTYLVTEFCADDEIRNADVIDPYGMGRSAYQETHDMLERVLPSLVSYIEKTFPQP